MSKTIKISTIIIIVFAFSYLTIACGEQNTGTKRPPLIQSDDKGNKIFGEIFNSVPQQEGHITIGNLGEFNFDVDKIKTVRDDIFNEGFFSIFDILAYFDDEGKIETEYHFEEDMNTYVIDSINGTKYWWYIAYYDGGWWERNVFRMDHYPYKDKMHINVYRIGEIELEEYHKVFREEVERKENNGGKIIIPELRVQGPGLGNLLFENVEIKPHNLRSDIFKEGSITAIDAIMTLGDEGEIVYDLNWYESIGTAGLIKNYFVEGINDDISIGRCGFVYEEGSNTYTLFDGNHIHIPPDARIINSPEYLIFFWICI